MTPGRASFMSPTKASLARFNPSLLPRPTSTGEGAQKLGQTPAEKQSSNGARKGATGNGNARRSQPTTPTRDVNGPYSTEAMTMTARAATASPGRTVGSLGGGMSAAPRRRSRTPGRESSPLKVLNITGELNVAASPPAAAKERTDTAQDIVDGQTEQELQDGAARRPGGIASFGKVVDVSDQVEPEEPDLPPTPTQLGLEPAPERPKGLLFSSPSRRAKRRKGSGVKSSPLKPRDPPPEEKPEKIEGSHSKVAPLPQVTKSEVDEVLLSKQQERERLSRQLRNLQADMTRLEGEVARTQAPADPRSQEEEDELLYAHLITMLIDVGLLLTFLRRSILATTNPTHKETPSNTKQPPLSQRLALFLPFSKRPLPPPLGPSPLSPPLPSHHPLPLSDPLPYLRVFTPLTISSTDILLPSTAPNAPLLQRQQITLASSHELLSVKLSLTANTTTQTIANLEILNLSPWAGPELGTWIRKRALDGDMSSIGWAIGRYWEVAQLRARCWERCEQDHGHLLAQKGKQGGKTVGKEKSTLLKRQGRLRKEDQTLSDDEPTNLDDDDPETPSRLDLLSHLGRTALLFQHDDVSLLISWRIDFDWTGEVQSHVEASASFPEMWGRGDVRGSLGKVGDAFEKLVKVKGVSGAVGVIVGLVLGE